MNSARSSSWFGGGALAIAALVVTSCILDTTNLTGRSPDGNGNDASPVDAGAADVSADAASTSSGCTGGAFLFCDDFDGRTDVKGAWDLVAQSAPGDLALDGDAVSKPNALLARVNAHTGDGTQARTLSKTVALGGKKALTVELALQLAYDPAQVGTKSGTFGWVLAIDDGTHFHSLDIEKDQIAFDMTTFGGGGNPYLNVPRLFPPDGSWHHVKVELLFDTSNGGAVVTVDGQPVESRGMNTLGSAPLSVLKISVGVMTDATGSAWPVATARFDDVRIY